MFIYQRCVGMGKSCLLIILGSVLDEETQNIWSKSEWGVARTGYGIPAHDGMGAGAGGEFFRRRRRRRRRHLLLC